MLAHGYNAGLKPYLKQQSRLRFGTKSFPENFRDQPCSYNNSVRWRNSAQQKIITIEKQISDLIKKAYAAFNARNIDLALTTMHPEVQWPKAFEGGYVSGHQAIREYWTRQWAEINPHVEPVDSTERPDGTLEITVHQIVQDLQGTGSSIIPSIKKERQ